MAINTGKPGEVIRLSPEDLSDDQREYIRIVQLGQDREATMKVVKRLAPHVTTYKKIDVSIALLYMLNDIIESHPKDDFMDRLQEDVAKLTTSFYYYKGTYINRKDKE